MPRAGRKIRRGHPHRGPLPRRRLFAHRHAVKSTAPADSRRPRSADFCHRLLGTAEADDPDAGPALKYSLKDAGGLPFRIGGADGRVEYRGPGVDLESGPGRYEFGVSVTDGELTDDAAVVVTVADVNEPPAFDQPSYEFRLDEHVRGSRPLNRVRASDPEEAGDVFYTLASGDAALFRVDRSSGFVFYEGPGEDFETGRREHRLSVRATDAARMTARVPVLVRVHDANEWPEAVGAPPPLVLEAGAPRDFDMAEYFSDPNGDPLTLVPSSSDPDVVAVSSSGLRLLLEPLAVGAAQITVVAYDQPGDSAAHVMNASVESSPQQRAAALERSLAAFGRSIGSQAVDVLGGRFGPDRPRSPDRARVEVGGRRWRCTAMSGEDCAPGAVAADAAGLLGARATLPGAGDVGGGAVDPAAIAAGGRPSAAFLEAFGDPRGVYGAPSPAPGAVPAPGGSVPDEATAGGLAFNPVSGESLLSESSFEVPLGGQAEDAAGAGGRPGWTVWGQGAAGGFRSGAEDGPRVEGRTRSAWGGADYRFGSGLLVGAAGSRSSMQSDFEGGASGEGEADARMTGLYPYLHWSPRDGLGVWGMAGFGRGAVEGHDAGGPFEAGLGMRMTAGGVRQALAGPLALKADAFMVAIRSADVEGMAGVTAAARRLRVAPELSGRWGGVRARVEMGARFDGGDADAGMGAEAGGELGFMHDGSGLTVEARGRTLLAHQAEGFREWGAGFAVRLQPRRGRPGDGEAPEGLSLSFAPEWGWAAGGAQALWAAEGGLGGLGGFGVAAPGQADAPGWAPDRVGLELGWGVALPGGGVVAPFGGWSREGAGGSRMNAGARWAAADLAAAGRARVGRLTLPRGLRLLVDFFAEQLAGPLGPPDRRFALVGRVSF